MNHKFSLAKMLVIANLLVACGGGSGGSQLNSPVANLPDPTLPPPAGMFGDGTLDEIVEWARAAHGVPAMGVVIVHNGIVVESAAEGLRSALANEPVTVDDLWHIGSLTKNITASLAGALIEMSIMSWNTRPIDIWPELDASIHSQFRNITVRQLLSHTAGLVGVNAAPSQYGDLAIGTIAEKRRNFAADLLGQTPIGPIGQESYSNGGYIIAAAMMETLMSDSWESLVTTYVFGPLGMFDSGFGAPGIPNDLSQPWGHWDQGANYLPVSPGLDADNPQVFGPAGTVHTSFDDYASYMIAHINGANGIDSFLSAGTFDVLHAPVANGSALGWGVREIEDEVGVLELVHAGSNQRWYSVVRLAPELNVGALFVVNAGGDMASAAIDALDDVLGDRFDNSR